MTAIRRSKASTRIRSAKRNHDSSEATPRVLDTNKGAARSVGESLLQRYREAKQASTRRALRTRLIERYRGLVEGMARGLVGRLPRSVDAQDLVNAGLWGLLQAIDNWRPERGAHFVPFMRLRVRGAMIDELRSLDYLPRMFRRHYRQVDQAREELRRRLDRDPSDAEIADEVGISETRMRIDYAAARPLTNGQAPVSGQEDDLREDSESAGFGDVFDRVPSAARFGDTEESPLDALTRRDLVEQIRAKLQPIEWEVLKLHYLEGKSGKDVARELRLSASRICQIHVRVLARLKAQFRGRS